MCVHKQQMSSTAPKPRAVLTRDDAIAIFKLKESLQPATKVSRFYGVSEKAVRDIWTGRTWSAETWHLDTTRALKIKPSGRPQGSRDTKPRKPRLAFKESSAPKSEEAYTTKKRALLSCGGTDARPVQQHRTCKDNFWPAGVTQICLVSVQVDAEFDKYCSPHTKSLDEQLFDWELDTHSRDVFDPFKADWLLQYSGTV